jgi:hypothetical protein
MTLNSDEPSPDKPLDRREISDAWLEMQRVNYASEFAAKVDIPDMSALIPPDYFQHVMPALPDFARNISAVAAATFPKPRSTGRIWLSGVVQI